MNIIIGLGCDRDTPLSTLETALDLALQQAGMNRRQIRSLASIDKKADETALLDLSRRHGWPLTFFSAGELAAIEVPNPSEVVMKYMGTPAVSEAAALLAAQTDMSDLLVEKFKYRGTDGRNATISIVKARDRA